MNLVPFAYTHRRALFVFLLLAIAAGVYAASTASRGIYPGVAFPRISVIAERGESPVRGMTIEVTRPIEQSVSAIPNLRRVRSKTVRGASELSLDFQPSTDMIEALSLVRARAAEASLPADVALTIERQTPAVFPVLSFNVMPDLAQHDDPVTRAKLAEWAELVLKPQLGRLPDAFMVNVQSGDKREFVFEADPLALARFGVDVLAVREAIATSNQIEAVGRSHHEGLQYQMLLDGQITSPDRILDVCVPREGLDPVELRHLGRVVETTEERTMIVTGGGTDSVVVSVFLRDGGKVTDLSRDVRAIIAESNPPYGGRIEMVYDQATLVNDSIAGVRDAIGIGALLSVVVLFLFLRDWRITLIAGLAIPISVVLTLALLPVFGESLNLMSLGGMAVAIGLIIDDAIVVAENVGRRLSMFAADASRPQRFAAIADATGEVVGAIVGSSLTTVVVFLPLVLLEGVVGQFFRSLSLTLALSILASMVVSLLYTPLMLLVPWLMPRSGARAGRLMTGLQNLYASAAGRFLNAPAVVGLLLLGVVAAGTAGLAGIGTGFLPEMDEGGFVLDYAMPVGTSLQDTDDACRRIEKILLETPEVRSLSRRTGAELGFFATEQFTGDMLVGLKPRAQRDHSVFEVLDGLRERFAREVPQVEIEFVQVMQDTINDLAGNPSPIEVKFFGSNYPELQAAAEEAKNALDRTPGIVDTKSGVSFGSPEYQWKIDPLAAARLGMSTDQLAAQASAQILGDEATRIQLGDQFLTVRVRYPDDWRSTVQGGDVISKTVFVGNPKLGSVGAGLVPLGSVAQFKRVLSENELERENQTPMVRVTAGVSGTDLGTASAAVRQAVDKLHLPPDIRVEYGGQAESQKAAFANLVLVFSLASGLVFLLLVVQFRSRRLPIVMFLAMPFGLLGGLYALYVTGVALNISSAMGLIMLVGLVVKNGIIMIEYAQHLHHEGKAPREAMIEAARVRLRPILMTTLAAIAGLFPLALGIGAGSELQRPLAIAVIGGLSVSTLFTLIVVPLGCVAFGGLATTDRHLIDSAREHSQRPARS
ncbi:MAG: AcrB/AcrD/AcrF family protein [Phycisphaera sp.]|nr:AcrB/AcrD/AcrF family protein [Phycisphaera sp.]